MEQPPRFVAKGASDLISELRRSLCPKQSPRLWFGNTMR